jgi:aminopeptidase N
MIKYFFLIAILLTSAISNAQYKTISKQEKLRGSITKERAWWDLLHYTLEVKVDDVKRYISGSNIVRYKVLKNHQVLQIDLQSPLKITRVIQNDNDLKIKTNGNAYFITLSEEQVIGKTYEIKIFYEGNPIESVRPPWSGGFTWAKDKNGKSFIATSNQGIGASIWWPCKDHMYDEPDDGALMIITPPKGLMDVSNGRLKKVVENSNETKTYFWEVLNPINNYGININIGDYVHFSEKYKGLNGDLDCDYYVISYNLEKAKEQFKQALMTLEAFEYWLGPYPFYEDGYKLVEVPYLGMEHQSSVTYGNNYKNGYRGKDLSGTGWGLKFDFIIIHESGHEWFANSITYKDIADMWIHEAFTSYSEALYLDYHFGTEAGNEYIIGTRKIIINDKPIIGVYNANRKGSSDMYPKGANMIHTIRQVIDDDEKFREILIGLNKEFYHQTVTTQQIEDYISTTSGIDFSTVFNQYLRTIKIPELEYQHSKSKIKYRFNNTVKHFNLPVKVLVNDKEIWIHPTSKWKELEAGSPDVTFEIDPNFYIIISEVK